MSCHCSIDHPRFQVRSFKDYYFLSKVSECVYLNLLPASVYVVGGKVSVWTRRKMCVCVSPPLWCDCTLVSVSEPIPGAPHTQSHVLSELLTLYSYTPILLLVCLTLCVCVCTILCCNCYKASLRVWIWSNCYFKNVEFFFLFENTS